jgi:hypothetical protein
LRGETLTHPETKAAHGKMKQHVKYESRSLLTYTMKQNPLLSYLSIFTFYLFDIPKTPKPQTSYFLQAEKVSPLLQIYKNSNISLWRRIHELRVETKLQIIILATTLLPSATDESLTITRKMSWKQQLSIIFLSHGAETPMVSWETISAWVTKEVHGKMESM